MAALHKRTPLSRRFSSPQNANSISFDIKHPIPPTGHTYPSRALSVSTPSRKPAATLTFSTSRCSERGCVFPVSSPQTSKCTYHRRQLEEPSLFRSHQPSCLLLDPARSLPADDHVDGSRKRDRLRMVELWEQFQTDGST